MTTKAIKCVHHIINDNGVEYHLSIALQPACIMSIDHEILPCDNEPRSLALQQELGIINYNSMVQIE